MTLPAVVLLPFCFCSLCCSTYAANKHVQGSSFSTLRSAHLPSALAEAERSELCDFGKAQVYLSPFHLLGGSAITIKSLNECSERTFLTFYTLWVKIWCDPSLNPDLHLSRHHCIGKYVGLCRLFKSSESDAES